jgi:hypothetical protein
MMCSTKSFFKRKRQKTCRSQPHVHGLEDLHGNRFWAISSDGADSELDVDEEIHVPDTLEILKAAV